ncbi:MAG: Crp/Fnr family transcriptional regulator [Actinobacteria bacterium]|nr:Crp/Fnr family transcriptional regulator [Actinomycetota bacterium]
MEWPLLAGIPADDVRAVLAASRRRVFGKGEVVFHRGDPADSLHLVVSGRFAIRAATPLGDTVAFSLRRPGESFGELALVEPGSQRSATVSALEPGETRALAYSEVERLRREHTAVDRVLLALLAADVRRLSGLLLDALFVPADRRVLRRLLELVEEGPSLALTQEELAQLAGTSRATVNKVLREEERRGTVRLDRGRMTVTDAEPLRKRARVGA